MAELCAQYQTLNLPPYSTPGRKDYVEARQGVRDKGVLKVEADM